jgi:hypothetical protein
MPPTKHNIPRLEKQISALSDALAHLHNEESFKELIRIIRFPGWTTPAEFALVSTLVDSMIQQTAILGKLQGELLKGSKLVAGK